MRIIDQSKGKFTIENTLKRVFDDNFLPKEEYVEHIVKEIPPTKKYEVAIEVFRNREEAKKKSDLAVFWNTLKKDLEPKELEDIRSEMSECLRYADKSGEVTSVVFLVGEDWQNLEHDARLRAENFLIRKLPTYLSDDPREGPHAYQFADVANALLELYLTDLMELKEEFASKIFSMFKKSSPAMTDYVVNSFGGILEEIDEYVPLKSLDSIIKKRLKSGDRQLVTFIDKFYSQKQASKLKEFLPPEPSSDDIDDELPF